MSALLDASIRYCTSVGVIGPLTSWSISPSGSAGSGPRAAACEATVRFFFIGISMTFTSHDMPRPQNDGYARGALRQEQGLAVLAAFFCLLFFAAAKKSRCRPAQGQRLKHANNARMPAKPQANNPGVADNPQVGAA